MFVWDHQYDSARVILNKVVETNPNQANNKVDEKAMDQQVAAYAVFAYLAAEAKDNFVAVKKVEAKK